jgi:hypothetical protein
LSPKVQAHEVQVIEWVSELENILDGIRRLPTGQRIAVKVINHFGDEVLKVYGV